MEPVGMSSLSKQHLLHQTALQSILSSKVTCTQGELEFRSQKVQVHKYIDCMYMYVHNKHA